VPFELALLLHGRVFLVGRRSDRRRWLALAPAAAAAAAADAPASAASSAIACVAPFLQENIALQTVPCSTPARTVAPVYGARHCRRRCVD